MYLFFILIVLVLLLYAFFFFQKEGFDNNRSSISHIDAIYYINLEKRKDRNQEFLDNFPEVDQSKIHSVKAHYYPENGAVGCLMSHITALSMALNDKGENILICEDDFFIKDMAYCNKMLNLFMDKIKTWDVIMLGQNTIESKDTGIETPEKEKIIKILNSQTASGYIIKRSYIPTLLEIYGEDMTEYVTTNKWGNYFTDQSWKVLQPIDNWYSFTPSVGVQRPSYSDIQNGYIDVEV